ncbi:MAG: SusC/RagA family TonB-linked outer membrane protein [Rickettsiales bacterium]|nr:SusC/RagA family TonB-linked outer membrane protein [Rickettsiales bacterium]
MRDFTNFKNYLLSAMLTLATLVALGQQRTISGQVTDSENGETLPGATVLEKGTTNGTVTDIDGNYSISVGNDAVLVVSFVGYRPIEITVGTSSVVNATLDMDVSSLEEVVVVGYGTQRKEDLTGAVSLVKAEEMQKQAATDLTQSFQGRVAGVSVTSDGQPGAAPSVRIRGISTFGVGGASAEPLYVVDGVPLTGGIRDFNPNNIESIQVLKDATAGAIYGNRAANGVVIITTKKGSKSNRLSVELNAYTGVQTIPNRIPVLDRADFQMMQNEVMDNAGIPRIAGNDPNSADYISNIDTDWQDEGYKDGKITNYNVNLSGGSDKTTYYVSMDYIDNEGTLVGSGPDYRRYSFRVNTQSEFGRFKFGENLLKMHSDENPLFFTTTINLPGGRPTLVNDLLQAAPTIPVYDENREGGFGGADALIHNSITLNVPGLNTLINNSTTVDRTLANLWGQIEIVEGLTYKLNMSYDQTAITDDLFVPEYDLGYFFPNATAFYQVATRNSSSALIENTLNYEKRFGKHDLKLLAGQSFQQDKFTSITTRGSGLEKPYIVTLASAQDFSVNQNIDNSATYSFFGRLNYSFDDTYLLTVNVRRDGSSRFSEENRYEVFPSIGLGWKLHNTFTLPEWLSDLKLRGGIGQVGNQFIANYAYQSTVNRGIPYQFNGTRVFGGAVTINRDPGIKWETRTTRSVGVDAVLFNGKIEFSAEYYSNTSEDILMAQPIPFSVGSVDPSIITNAGSMQNSGIELSAIYHQNIGELRLDIAPNFYTVHNEILDLGNVENLPGTGTYNEVGRSLGEHYGFVFDGIFQDQTEIDAHATQFPGTAPGDIRFKDISGPDGVPDGVVNDEFDRVYLGQGMPTYYYGLNITAGYKSFDLTIFGQGAGGNLINSNLYRGLMPTSSFTNWHEDILDRWTSENPSNTVPRVVWNDPNQNGRNSDRPGWLQKGDYFRIQTISIGYTLPQSLISKAKLQSVRVYGTLQNVLTFQHYKGYNPDFQAGILNPGFDFGTFPRPRTSMLGVQIKF